MTTLVENHYTVYMHLFPNGKRYVGITGQSLKERWRVNGNGYKPQKLVCRAIQKYKWENVKHIIVAEKLSVDEAGELEKSLISKYNTTNPSFGYNQSIGGENSPIGVKRSEETRRKLSESHKGKYFGDRKCHLTEEQKQRLREINRGKTVSEEVKKILSEKNKGRKPSALAIQRVKEVCNKPVICIETGKRYDSATIAAKETGVPRNTITRHCRGEVKKPRWKLQ